MKARIGGSSAALALACALLAAPRPTVAQDDVASHAQSLVVGLDFDEARRVLAPESDDPRVLLERARLAVYELDCDGAAAILARPEVAHVEGGEDLADIAHGCQRVTASLAVDRDEARGVEVRWQDEYDRALAPLIVDTVAKARDALTRDLGVDWPKPTRVVVVRDLLSLSAMTGLPYESAQTTGTVAVAKWGRVTLLSPRASHHGYPWRDTLAHELTHLAVTRATRDRAPLWLQEGVAKREEIRWRPPEPYDERPPPEAVVQRGAELNLTIPLDKLGPSIAMLPSADAATVAFAEVTSFVRFYADTEAAAASAAASTVETRPLPKLFARLREGKNADEALQAATGTDLKGWDGKWRASLATRPRMALPELMGLGTASQPPRELDRLRDLRDRARLAQLLLERDHAPEALKELDRIEMTRAPVPNDAWDRAMGDPSVRWLRARALEAANRREEGEALVADPAQVLSSYGPWWATRGRWARLRGDEGTAAGSFSEAIAADPFDPEGACETIDPAPKSLDPAKAPLCDAARRDAPPPYDTE